MPSAWFLCPYDVTTHPSGAIGRRCAMFRYLPVLGSAIAATWYELECLGNLTLVKVNAPMAMLTTISADPDFTRIPTGVTTVPAGQRPAVRSRLLAIGYTDSEITATGWNLRQIIRLIASLRHEVRERADLTGFEVVPGSPRHPRRPEDADEIDRRVPDS